MKKYSMNILIVLILTSCSSLKSTAPKVEENADLIIFNKGVSIFDIIDETNFDYELENVDTMTVEGKIKFDVLYNKKEEILDLAFEQFEKVVEEYSKSKLYHKSLYNLAHISSLMDYEEDEIKYLQMILNSDANDKEFSGRSGLMANPYANFKNEASNRLTDIYIEKKDFETALRFKKINEKYPLQHFCGNAFAADEIHNAKQYAKIYIGLRDNEKALNHLLPHIFNNGFANNSNLVHLTTTFLKKNYSIDKLRTGFESSIENIYSKVEKEGNNQWTSYFIKYFDVEIEIPSWKLSFETDEDKIKAELKKTIIESEFYKKLYE